MRILLITIVLEAVLLMGAPRQALAMCYVHGLVHH